MLISEDIKLDYSDVLIRPKRSTLTSRYDVDMTRTYKFVHSKKEWTGVPIMASNMDTVGTPEMYKVLSGHQIITCPARHYLKNNPTVFSSNYQDQHICMMGGLEDINVLKTNAEMYGFIGIDVANGYTISVIDSLKELREKCPDETIVVGNVVICNLIEFEVNIAGLFSGHQTILVVVNHDGCIRLEHGVAGVVATCFHGILTGLSRQGIRTIQEIEHIVNHQAIGQCFVLGVALYVLIVKFEDDIRVFLLFLRIGFFLELLHVQLDAIRVVVWALTIGSGGTLVSLLPIRKSLVVLLGFHELPVEYVGFLDGIFVG